ncbi:hypothetical protein BJX61DRAFT_539710 [Aspergillus egyptiacus]|nr:hypothetical protein BJX61DRAFT_539710 [Aspergillus egyptiacus]
MQFWPSKVKPSSQPGRSRLMQMVPSSRVPDRHLSSSVVVECKSQCEKDKSELQQKLEELESQIQSGSGGLSGGSRKSTDAQHRDNHWISFCSNSASNSLRKFTLGGKKFQVKCGVRTTGANEEIWLRRTSILEYAEACAATPNCLGVGWRSTLTEANQGVRTPVAAL